MNLYSMKKYTLGLYEKALPDTLEWSEKLRIAKEVGYDFIEISIDESEERLSRLDMSKENRLNLVKQMYEFGIPIRSLCLSAHRKYPLGSLDDETVNKSLEIMEKAIQFADDLGVRIIMLAGYDVYYSKSTPETVERFKENLKIAVEMASAKGIVLGFETMETEFMNTVDKSMNYVNLVNSPFLGVYPDSGNIKNAAVTYDSNVYDDICKGTGKVMALHLKETIPGHFREIPYGTGHVDFERMIDTAWKIGVRRYVTEFWYVGQENWLDDVKDAYKRMTQILDEKAG